ncbi:hypothetical protein [Actinoplanes sp. HUAS TT8]|uniref:hypothetical protein n=1 Tax=Actinoplanes sp. HUAS TT8 TaxID=3447453 RepID=UPI003F5276EE
MSLWRRMRGELAGAWRSVRYDLRGRPGERPEGPDVTSTGLSTFPGSLMEWRTVPPETNATPPRRFVAVSALCLLALVGAIGSYLLVTRGLAAADDRPEAAPAVPAAPAPPAVETPVDPATSTPDDAIGPPSRPKTVRPAPTTTDAPPPEPTKTDMSGTAPQRATTHRPPVTTPECDCVTPPVPTPTVPSPSGSTASDPGGSTSVGPSATPGGSMDPSPGVSSGDTDGKQRHARRHWPKNG